LQPAGRRCGLLIGEHQLIKLLRLRLVELRHKVAVTVERGLDRGVAQLRLDVLRVGAVGDQQAGIRVAEVVEPDAAELGEATALAGQRCFLPAKASAPPKQAALPAANASSGAAVPGRPARPSLSEQTVGPRDATAGFGVAVAARVGTVAVAVKSAWIVSMAVEPPAPRLTATPRGRHYHSALGNRMGESAVSWAVPFRRTTADEHEDS